MADESTPDGVVLHTATGVLSSVSFLAHAATWFSTVCSFSCYMLLNAAADVLDNIIVHAAASVPDGVVLHAAANDDAAAVLEGEGGRGNLGLHAAGTDVGLFAKLEHVHVLGVEVRQKPITKKCFVFPPEAERREF